MAKINEDDIDALRDKADIVDVISSYSQLKRSGGHTWKGLCPFHSEKTPSFTVDSAKGLYHCFGCGEGGTIYTFVQKLENLPFPDAVEWLARREGFQLRYEEMKPGEKKAHSIKMRIVEANQAACDFFHKALMEHPDSVPARQYLSSRGFGREVAERWKLGYAPGRDSLTKHLLGKGFTTDVLIQADLTRKSDRDGSLYDSFRQRIIFPTWNLQGDVVAFGARKMPNDTSDGPKYLNTSETPVFSKSRVMYGLDRAKSAIARESALVAEGYTDVIALHEAGVNTGVATNGVALGESHFELLKKFSSRVVLMFDADDAGKGATERGFGIHHRIGLEVMVAPLPPGRDPADVVKEDGPEGIQKIIEGAQPLMLFKLEQTIGRMRLDTPEARSSAVAAAVQVLVLDPDPVARHEYAFKAAEMIGVDQEVIHRALSEQRPGASRAAGGTTRERDRRLPGHVKVEREALHLLLTRPVESAEWSSGLVSESDFTSAARRELYTAAMGRNNDVPLSDLEQRLSPDALALLTELTVGEEDVSEMNAEDLRGRAREIFTRIRVFSLERDIKSRGNTLADVNPLDAPEEHDRLFTELVRLQAERRDLLKQVLGE